MFAGDVQSKSLLNLTSMFRIKLVLFYELLRFEQNCLDHCLLDDLKSKSDHKTSKWDVRHFRCDGKIHTKCGATFYWSRFGNMLYDEIFWYVMSDELILIYKNTHILLIGVTEMDLKSWLFACRINQYKISTVLVALFVPLSHSYVQCALPSLLLLSSSSAGANKRKCNIMYFQHVRPNIFQNNFPYAFFPLAYRCSRYINTYTCEHPHLHLHSRWDVRRA